MADRSLHYRTHSVTCLLSDEEHRHLRDVCAALRLNVRDVLLIGLRRCERRLAEERRKQQGRNGND